MTLTIQEFAEILIDVTIYQCTSETCSDNGGVCTLLIPSGFEPPTSCTNIEAFSEEMGTECDCKWVEL